MRKRLLLACIGLLSLVGLSAQTQIPITSTGGTEVWYHIKCAPRNSARPDAMWLAGSTSGGGLTVTEFSSADTQLWKVIPNGTGVALINKAYGNYMNSDLRDPQSSLVQLTSIATMPTTALKFVPTSSTPFVGENGVCIVDVNTSVSPSNVITFDPANSFGFYSAGSGIFVPIVYSRSINVNSAVTFYESKDFLSSAIAQAKNILNNCSIGDNPGQYSSESKSEFQSLIDAAQVELDDPQTTNQRYVEAANELNAVIVAFKQTVIFPKTSTDSESKWYYLQGTRPANTYITSTGPSGEVKDLPIIPDDTQLWKMVKGNNGFYLQNKASGEYLNSDPDPGAAGVILSTQSAPPTNELRFLVSRETTNKVARFWIENVEGFTPAFRLHAGGSYHNYSLMNWTGGADDNCSWLLMDYAVAQRGFLKDALTTANTFADNCSVGNNPGQFSQTDIDTFKAVLAAAQLVYNDAEKTADQYTAAITNLNTAKATLISKAITPVISTETSSTWYTIQGLRPVVTPLIASTSTSDSIKYQSILNNDAELWKFVASGDGFAIQNKATSKYLDTDAANNAELITVENKPVTALKFRVSSDNLNKTFRFWIENTGTDVTFRLHAGTSVPMNYIDDAADNCTWFIAEPAGATAATFVSLKKYSHDFFSQTTAGSEFGKFSTAGSTAFSAILAEADAVDLATISNEELKNKLYKLQTGLEEFKNSKITDLNSIVSTKESPRWFFITGCNSSGAAGYNMRIAKSQDKVRGIAKSDTSTDQMWRFEINPDDPTTVKMINKTAEEQFVITGESEIGSMATDGGTYFTLGTHGDGYSVMITYPGELLHCDGSNQIVGWYDNVNPNSAWRIDAVGFGAGVKNITSNMFHIRNNNGIITVDGIEKFDLYSVMGQKLNSKSILRKGVYIVKVGNKTQKFILK